MFMSIDEHGANLVSSTHHNIIHLVSFFDVYLSHTHDGWHTYFMTKKIKIILFVSMSSWSFVVVLFFFIRTISGMRAC